MATTMTEPLEWESVPRVNPDDDKTTVGSVRTFRARVEDHGWIVLTVLGNGSCAQCFIPDPTLMWGVDPRKRGGAVPERKSRWD